MKISNSFGRLDDLFVLSGKDLIGYVTDYDKLIPRTILEDIVSYLEDLNQPKLLELYGLRRTGKTVLIFQSISYLLKKGISSEDIIYIECNENNSIYQIIDLLKPRKFKYVFIDEITYLNDFISASNILCTCCYGIKTVLTGTDSLSFNLADSKMFDRYIRISTTFISYKEWYKLKNGNTDITDYIHNGGILGNYKSTNTYINESINNNIRNSLRNIVSFKSDYTYETLLSIVELYPKLVIKVTENFSNNFIRSLILRSLSSSLNEGLSKLYKGFPNRDKNTVNKVLTDMLQLDLNEFDIKQNDLDILSCYLYDLDLYKKIERRILKDNKIIISYDNIQVQPVIRYSQYMEFLDILEKKLNIFNNNKEDFENIFIPILEGKLLEQIIICNILKVYKEGYDIFSYRENDNAEIDLVIKNCNSNECILIEVKRAFSYKSKYHKWLINEGVLENLNTYLGISNIKRKIVLYQGEDKFLENINVNYLNVEKFLLNIDNIIV